MLTQQPTWDCQRKLNISSFFIPHTFTYIRLSHLYQKGHAHCIAIKYDAVIWGRWDMVDLYWGVGRRTGVSSYSFKFFSCAFVFFFLTHILSLTKTYWSIEVVVSVVKVRSLIIILWIFLQEAGYFKLKIVAPRWNYVFELLDGCYSVSGVHDFIDCIMKNLHYPQILFISTSTALIIA